MKAKVSHFKPGIPTDPATTMGAIVTKVQFERVLGYIESAKQEGARLLCGGGRPSDPALAKGFYVEPTVFADVRPDMRIAREEIFGPVLAILKWTDEAKMLEQVNSVEYGLTCSIWTNDLSTAHRTAAAVRGRLRLDQRGGKHFLGAPFGGFKQSRHRARGMLRGDARLHAGEEYPREAQAGQITDRAGPIRKVPPRGGYLPHHLCECVHIHYDRVLPVSR